MPHDRCTGHGLGISVLEHFFGGGETGFFGGVETPAEDGAGGVVGPKWREGWLVGDCGVGCMERVKGKKACQYPETTYHG